MSWAEISEISLSGTAQDVFSVGDTKDIQMTTGETVTFEIIGFNHENADSMYDDHYDERPICGITFASKNLMSSRYKMDEDGQYEYKNGFYSATDLSQKLWRGGPPNNIADPVFPEEVLNVMRVIHIETYRELNTGAPQLGSTACNAFILSEQEVFGTKTNAVISEGTQYERFTNSGARIKRLANGSGAAISWWLRSYAGGNSQFCIVDQNGQSSTANMTSEQGLCLAFCV